MSNDTKRGVQDETSDTGLHERFHEKPAEPGAEATYPAADGAPAAATDAAPEAGASAAVAASDEAEPVAVTEAAHDAPGQEAAAAPAADPTAAETTGAETPAAESETGVRSASEPTPPAATARRGGGVSSVVWALALLIGGGALAVWGLPKIAPSLPAPLAAYLAPAAEQADDALGALRSAVEARVAQVESTADAAAILASDVASALESAAAERAALREELAVLASQPQPQISGAASEEAVATLRERLDALAAQVDALEGAQGPDSGALAEIETTLGALRGRLEAVETEALAAREAATAATASLADLGDLEAQRERVEREADNARRAAAMATALAQIDRAMTLGQPFVEPLTALTAAAEQPAPAALTKAAATGAPTRESLKASYPGAAYDAISATLENEAEARGGFLSGVAAKLQARVTGLPSEAIPGDSITAVLSRARITLLNGDVDATIAAIESLPAPAQQAMADWVEGARLRSDADAALSSWRNELKLTL